MKAIQLAILILAASITANTYAAPKPPSGPQDVNVTNDETNPVPVVIQNNTNSSPSTYQFIGFSTDTVQGDVGFLGMTSACQVSYGPNARICNSKEVAQSLSLTSHPGITGWIHPFIIGNGGAVVDYSGYTFGGSLLTCAGSWSNATSSKYGLILQGENMAFNVTICSTNLPVSCCTPQ